MSRILRFALAFVFVASTDRAIADEWQSQSHRESPIEFHSNWYWATPDRGKYDVVLTDNRDSHLYSATWGNWPSPRLQIVVERLAPGFIWRSGPPTLDEDYLEWWYELSDAGVSGIKEISCDARQCVTFLADRIYNCGAILNYSIVRENWTAGEGLDDSDELSGFICLGEVREVTTDILNKVFASIAIRADDGRYLKQATSPSTVDLQGDAASTGDGAREQQAEPQADVVEQPTVLDNEG